MNLHANLRRVAASQATSQERYHYATPYISNPFTMTDQHPPPPPPPTSQGYAQPQPQPQQPTRNVSPAELSDTEILVQNGYADTWHLMTERGLNPYHNPDIEVAKQIIGSMRVTAQAEWDWKAWQVMMGKIEEVRALGQESLGGFEKMREEWWQSQLEWAHWDRQQAERERKTEHERQMEHETRIKRESTRSRRR